MFERYTERARRVLFFSRYEASQLGSVSIETEHLLLGLVREGAGLTRRIFARAHLSLEDLRNDIEGRMVFHEKIPTSVEMPFSPEAKRVLLAVAEEADRLQHDYIGTEHLLLGLLREERSVAGAMLIEKGLRLDAVRNDVVQLLDEAAAARQQQQDVSMPVKSKQGETQRTVRVVVVVAKPHDAIDERLLEGARHALTDAGVDDRNVTVVQVPGISEIPMAVQYAAESARFDVAICLCSLRQTMMPHIETTLSAVAHALQFIASRTGMPFTSALLTTESVDDATAGPMAGPANQGYAAATAALEMVAVIRSLRDT